MRAGDDLTADEITMLDSTRCQTCAGDGKRLVDEESR
jgi:hypothetical protein